MQCAGGGPTTEHCHHRLEMGMHRLLGGGGIAGDDGVHDGVHDGFVLWERLARTSGDQRQSVVVLHSLIS